VKFGALLLKLTVEIYTIKRLFYKERGEVLPELHGQRPLLFKNTPFSRYGNVLRFGFEQGSNANLT